MVPNEYVDISYCAMTNYTWEGDLMVVEERGLNDAGLKMRQGSFMYPTEGQPGVLTVDAEGVPSAPYVVRKCCCSLRYLWGPVKGIMCPLCSKAWYTVE